MSIPTPPADNSGGYMVLKYTDGTKTHRLRAHVLAFNLDSTGSYVTPPGGGEASVSASFTALATKLAPNWGPSTTISLDAVFQNVSGVITEVFTITPPSAVVGTNSDPMSANEVFLSHNMKTSGGHRMRFFAFSVTGWVYHSAQTDVANSGGNYYQKLCAYLTATTTAIVGHDGTRAVGNLHSTWGTNKKLRRRAGNA